MKALPAPANVLGDSETVDLTLIAQALQRTYRNTALRAESESWPYTTQAVRGGQKRLYAVGQLPEPVRGVVREYLMRTRMAAALAQIQLPETGPTFFNKDKSHEQATQSNSFETARVHGKGTATPCTAAGAGRNDVAVVPVLRPGLAAVSRAVLQRGAEHPDYAQADDRGVPEQAAANASRSLVGRSSGAGVASPAQAARSVLATRQTQAQTSAPTAPGHALALNKSEPGDDAYCTTEQREKKLRRQIVKRAMDALIANGCTLRQAAHRLLEQARADELPPAIQNQLREARDRRGKKGSDGFVSVPTLYRWYGSDDLLPKPSRDVDLTVRAWHVPLFALLDRPQKPTLRWAHEKLMENWRAEWEDPAGSGIPSYSRVQRAREKRSELDKLKGQHTGSALRSKLFYQHRRYDDLVPGSEIHADGWNTHFRAPHPVTGEFVTYEVWHAHDTHTRWVPPFAVGLRESSTIINECLRQTVMALGMVTLFQTDHTGSIKNHAMLDEISGLAERLGVQIIHPAEVGNSQANGMAENFNTWLDRESRELATYQHPDRMDSGTFVRTRRLTNQMVKAADPAQREQKRQAAAKLAKGLMFDSYEQAIAWLEAKRLKWNAHHHRSLPKIKCPATGRLRHMSPQEALDGAKAAGWEPMLLTQAELADAFRAHYRKKVTRGSVTPYGGMRYRDPLLDHILGEEVLVAVDEDDYAQVWVKDLKGQLICVAKFVEAVGSRCESLREHAERKRAEARIKLRENGIASIAAERAVPALEMDDGSRLMDGLVGGLVGDLSERQPVERAEAPQADPTKTYLARKEAEQQAERKRLDAESDIRLAEILANNRHTGEDDDTLNFESAAG